MTFADDVNNPSASQYRILKQRVFSARNAGLPSVASIRAAVCSVYEINPEQLGEHNRRPTLVEARCVAIYFLRTLLLMSFPEIGRELNHDHTTVIAGFRKIERFRFTVGHALLAGRMAEVARKLMVNH
jgi:chromosomal replication initiation ATPase DnaA